MIYPPQTSLIPVTVAIARYVESHGFTEIYPFWYLGVPLKFLTGPVIPGILVGLHKFMPGLTLFDITYTLMAMSFLLGALGWGLLAKRLSEKKLVGIFVALLFLVLPWKWLSALALSETAVILAKNFLPWTLTAFYIFLKKKSILNFALVVASFTTLLLIHTSAIPTLAVGLVGILLAYSVQAEREDDGQLQRILFYGKRAALVFGSALLIATFWYSPSFWLVLLSNPSVGGKPGFEAILGAFNWLKMAFPLALAVLIAFWGRPKGKMEQFFLVWILTFAFLTVYRFLSNPGFWQDWTSWLFELETGLAFVLAAMVGEVRTIRGVNELKLLLRNEPFGLLLRNEPFGLLLRNRKLVFAILLSLLLPCLLTWKVYNLLDSPKLVSTSLPKGLAGLHQLAGITKDHPGRVFLSGSTVFWADALYDLNQVRGGRDEVATYPWQKEAYEIREGSSQELTKKALEALGVTYVLVHEEGSFEYYHDFKNLGKWENVGKKIWSAGDDSIYQIL